MENETKRIMPLSFVVCGTCGKRSWKGGGTRAAGTAHARQRGRKDSFWPHVPSQHSQNTYIICEGIYICNMYIYIINPVILEYPFFQLCSWTRTKLHLEYAHISCSSVFSPFGLCSGSLCTPLCSLFLFFFSSSFHILIWFFITLCSEK